MTQELAQFKVALNNRHLSSFRVLSILWAFIGVLAVTVFAVAEPWSGKLFEFLVVNGISEDFVYYGFMPIVMIFRGVILVEFVGYFYHRFLEHLGFATRLIKQVRKNQKNHWKHHMIDYPVGPVYIKNKPYMHSQKGLPWEWIFPGIILVSSVFYFQGITAANVILLSTVTLYMLFFALVHSRFHVKVNPWVYSKYFHWLEDIHVLHHYDQTTNYSITNPLSDIIFGTYLSPKKHEHLLKDARIVKTIYASDLINWSYLVNFAWPKEQTVFIANLKDKKEEKKFKNVLSKVNSLYKKYPDDFFIKYYLDKLESVNSIL